MRRSKTLSALAVVVGCSSACFAQADGFVDLEAIDLTDEQESSDVYDPAGVGWKDDLAVALLPSEIVDRLLGDPGPENERRILQLLRAHVLQPEIAEYFNRGAGKSVYDALVAALGEALAEGSLSVRRVAEAGQGHVVIVIEAKKFRLSRRLPGPDPNIPSGAVEYFFIPEAAAVLRQFGEVAPRLGYIRSIEYRIRAAERLSEVSDGWRNYLRSGYSQYPWEVLANSALYDARKNNFGPPRWQLVLAHPEAGVSVGPFDKTDDARVEPNILVHGLGCVYYSKDRRSWFAGGSISGIVDNENGFGAGLSLHAGTAKLAERFPHVTMGIYWPDMDEGNFFSDPVVGVSIDVWRLLDAEGGDQTFLGKLKGLVGQ